MEEELKCPVCKQLYNNPVLLPCTHSLCLNCAVHIQIPAQQNQPPSEESLGNLGDLDYPEIDKLSILSETDSGVVCTSRPNSYVGTPNIQGILFPPLQSNALSMTCPICHKIVYFDENGVHNLPKNRVLHSIVDKYRENKNLVIKCQLCEENPKDATIMCEQCEVYYCDACRENCHPARGPLAKHNLVQPSKGKNITMTTNKIKETKCTEHTDEQMSMYCMVCKLPVCYICLQDGRHTNHDVQILGAMCKAQKTELSQNLQALSEKAKNATEFIGKLKMMSDQVQENCVDFEASIINQCDELIDTVQARKQQLVNFLMKEKDYKIKMLKEQITQCTAKLQQTTGLLQFSIEALKENDPTAFLQIGTGLINRVCNIDMTWHKEMSIVPRVASEFELTLDNKSTLLAIEGLNFIQMKPNHIVRRTPKAPGIPIIIPEECSAENNSVTIAWQPHSTSFVEGHILELDDGNEGTFREVYCGKETICTIDGLHFNSMYNARVKSFNSAGEGDFSEVICLQTAEVAWFTLDSASAHPDIIFSNENMSVTCNSYEHRVVFGSVGFSRGIHYWEIVVDRYDNHPDPAFGIARFDVAKDIMLGKDDKGWSMYIDNQRSWFLHFDKHENRTEGGIEKGAVVGMLLDLDRHTLSFYVNEEPQGPVAFSGLHGVFYPAISLNRNVQLTLHSGLDPPIDHESEGEGS